MEFQADWESPAPSGGPERMVVQGHAELESDGRITGYFFFLSFGF